MRTVYVFDKTSGDYLRSQTIPDRIFEGDKCVWDGLNDNMTESVPPGPQGSQGVGIKKVGLPDGKEFDSTPGAINTYSVISTEEKEIGTFDIKNPEARDFPRDAEFDSIKSSTAESDNFISGEVFKATTQSIPGKYLPFDVLYKLYDCYGDEEKEKTFRDYLTLIGNIGTFYLTTSIHGEYNSVGGDGIGIHIPGDKNHGAIYESVVKFNTKNSVVDWNLPGVYAINVYDSGGTNLSKVVIGVYDDSDKLLEEVSLSKSEFSGPSPISPKALKNSLTSASCKFKVISSEPSFSSFRLSVFCSSPKKPEWEDKYWIQLINGNYNTNNNEYLLPAPYISTTSWGPSINMEEEYSTENYFKLSSAFPDDPALADSNMVAHGAVPAGIGVSNISSLTPNSNIGSLSEPFDSLFVKNITSPGILTVAPTTTYQTYNPLKVLAKALSSNDSSNFSTATADNIESLLKENPELRYFASSRLTGSYGSSNFRGLAYHLSSDPIDCGEVPFGPLQIENADPHNFVIYDNPMYVHIRTKTGNITMDPSLKGTLTFKRGDTVVETFNFSGDSDRDLELTKVQNGDSLVITTTAGTISKDRPVILFIGYKVSRKDADTLPLADKFYAIGLKEGTTGLEEVVTIPLYTNIENTPDSRLILNNSSNTGTEVTPDDFLEGSFIPKGVHAPDLYAEKLNGVEIGKLWTGTENEFRALGVTANNYIAKVDKDNNIYLIEDEGYFNRLRYGGNWSAAWQASGITIDLGISLHIAYGNGVFVMADDSSGAIYYSNDGINWPTGQKTLIPTSGFSKIRYINNIFLAVSGNNIIWQNDGPGDAYQHATTNNTNKLYDIKYFENYYWVVGSNVITKSSAYNNWENAITFTVEGTIHSIAYGNNTYVIVGQDSDNLMYWAYSNDSGSSWTRVKTSLTDLGAGTLTDIVFYNNRFVAVGGISNNHSGVIIYSDDGVSINIVDYTIDTPLHSIIYGNGRFVTVGSYSTTDGLCLYSEDGVSWKSSSLPRHYGAEDIAYGNGKYVVSSVYSADPAIAYSFVE